MFQHIGLFVFSAVFGFGLERVVLERITQIRRRAYHIWKAYVSLIKFNTRTKGLVFAALVPAVVFSYWHYPPNFDLTATNGLVHISEHLSYIISGSLLGASLLAIPRKFKAALLVVGFMTAGHDGLDDACRAGFLHCVLCGSKYRDADDFNAIWGGWNDLLKFMVPQNSRCYLVEISKL